MMCGLPIFTGQNHIRAGIIELHHTLDILHKDVMLRDVSIEKNA